MFLTITSIIVAACFGIAFTLVCQSSNQNDRLRCKIKELRSRLDESTRAAKDLSRSLDNICKANVAEDPTYIVVHQGGGVMAVYRRSFCDEHEYHTFIKSFTDEDTEFNQREAEGLLDKLNEK